MAFSDSSVGGKDDGLLTIARMFAAPIVATIALFALTLIFSIENREPYSILAAQIFVITFFVYREMGAGSTLIAWRPRDYLQRSIASWAIVIAVLAVLGFLTQAGDTFSRRVLLTWAVITPLAITATEYWLYAYRIYSESAKRTAVIAGVSDLSRRLFGAIKDHPGLGIKVLGWFDDRAMERLGPIEKDKVLGPLLDLPEYVKKNSIDVIYIALPIKHEERTKRLLDELHDTTASIYFIPDIFVFDLIQSRVDVLSGIPVLALCETPFYGLNGLVKRLSDLVLASVVLILALPAMLAVAAGVAITTSGSVIFKQRRYGLDGCEIVIYKFRSMTTSDDSDHIQQASRDDDRITPFGRFIRKYSLDELPQLINVLQGRMSMVGPRPHAVAHNEEYRQLIKGYMIRHKVAPGITGLAQVRGHRGETTTVDQMQARIESDLEYLRRWSLGLDIKILWLTAWRVFSDGKAY